MVHGDTDKGQSGRRIGLVRVLKLLQDYEKGTSGVGMTTLGMYKWRNFII